jgi:hypothetical protein
MKAILRLMTIVFVLCCSAQGAEVKDMLLKAIPLEGKEYWKARKEIVAKGPEIVAELTKIQKDKTSDWKLQLMAGICGEWIERQADIEAMENKNWESDPDYNPEWNGYRPGPWIGLRKLVIRRYQEEKLWFYCLEAMWKGIEKFPYIWRAEKENWEAACEWAVEDSPFQDSAVRLLEERLNNDLLFKNKKTHRSFLRLVELKSNSSLPVLLKAWKAQGSMHDEYVFKIMSLAGPDDVDMLEEFMKDSNVKYSRSEFMFKEHVKKLKAIRDAKKTEETIEKQQ